MTNVCNSSKLFPFVVLILSFIAGCGGTGPTKTATDELRVCCTTGQVADMVRAIGGDQVIVEVLIGPGVDPHSFRQSRADAETLDQAQVIFYNGLHLEGRLSETLEKLSDKKATLSLGEELLRLHPDRIRRPEGPNGQPDPHVWFDAELWSFAVPAVIEKLSSLRPNSRDYFSKRGADYQSLLRSLHDEARLSLAEIPAEQRVLVTAHDAFGYFSNAYGVEVHGLQGISTVDEAGLADINALVELAVTRKIRAVFVESSVPRERLQQVINGCEARGHKITIGGELYSDALGAADTPEGNYAGMFRYNVRTITAALR